MANILIGYEWEEARLQIARLLDEALNKFDLASSFNMKEAVSVTSNGGTEVELEHGYNGVPSGYIVVGQSGAGSLYYSKASDNTKMYFKSDVTGITFNIVIY